jgi:glycerophosphoryl diester phosphodiesterase
VHPAIAADRPLVFAHRGGAGLAPENTIPAFDRGLALGVDGLELDVHLARDGTAVVHHDATLDRTTDASGPVSARDAAELARVNACAGFERAGRTWDGPVVGVPTLREVLQRYPDTRIIVELKGESPGLVRAVLGDVRAASAENRVCLGSFHWRILRAVRRLEPRLATSASRAEVRMALYSSWLGLAFRRRRYLAFQVPERSGPTRVVSRRFVRVAHHAGLVVQVWTVDAREDIDRLLEWGVDAVITDRPDVAVPAVAEWARKGQMGGAEEDG